MQIRTQSLQSEYDHVYSGDPAIDRSVEGWREKYDRALELSALNQLPLVAGQKPAVWRLRHLTRGERSKVGDLSQADGVLTAMNVALQLALVGVRDAVDATGAPFNLERTATIGRFRGVPEETIDKVAEAFGGETIVGELGVRVLDSFNPRKG